MSSKRRPVNYQEQSTSKRLTSIDELRPSTAALPSEDGRIYGGLKRNNTVRPAQHIRKKSGEQELRRANSSLVELRKIGRERGTFRKMDDNISIESMKSQNRFKTTAKEFEELRERNISLEAQLAKAGINDETVGKLLGENNAQEHDALKTWSEIQAITQKILQKLKDSVVQDLDIAKPLDEAVTEPPIIAKLQANAHALPNLITVAIAAIEPSVALKGKFVAKSTFKNEASDKQIEDTSILDVIPTSSVQAPMAPAAQQSNSSVTDAFEQDMIDFMDTLDF